MLLALGDHGADAGLGVKARNARAASAHPLGQRALRVELKLQLAGQILPHEFGVLADIGRDHLLHLPRLKQLPDAEPVDAGIVGGESQVLGAGVADRGNQKFRDAAEAEAAGGDEHAVEEQAVQRSGGVGEKLSSSVLLPSVRRG